jgi:hypothetical protein
MAGSPAATSGSLAIQQEVPERGKTEVEKHKGQISAASDWEIGTLKIGPVLPWQ